MVLGLIKWLLRVLPIVYMIAVWVMSSNPADAVLTLPRWDSIVKESLHLVEFGILYVLLVMALLTFTGLTKRWTIILIVFASCYGILDEIHQSFVPYRSATMIDVVKDIIGVLLASWFVNYLYKKNKHRLRV